MHCRRFHEETKEKLPKSNVARRSRQGVEVIKKLYTISGTALEFTEEK